MKLQENFGISDIRISHKGSKLVGPKMLTMCTQIEVREKVMS